jgi:ribosomal-protein-alanine N-acetyltransferase
LNGRPFDGALRFADATVLDVDEVLEIERKSFGSPWPRETFERELENAQSRFVTARAGGGAMAGFAIYWIAGGELHLLNLAIHPDWRRKGIARAMMERLAAEGGSKGCDLASLEVRKSNQAAVRLYLSLGWVAVGLRPGYYGDNNEDAIVMTCGLGGCAVRGGSGGVSAPGSG